MSRWRPETSGGPVWSRLPAARPTAVRRPDTYDLWIRAAGLLVIGTIVFNFFLAFLNTRVMGVSQNIVMLAELVLIAGAMILAADRRAGLYALLAVYLAYVALILALRPELDLKAIRDGLIPIAFYFLGRRVRDIESVDRIVLLSAGIVVAIGFFEYFLLDVFIANVNVLKYYISRGTLEVGDNLIEDSSLFISGTRMQGRNLLPFLGTHRVSSVFLEPVAMGNYGAFLVLWAVFRKDMTHRWLLLAAACIVIVLGDARFGMMVCFALIAVIMVYRVIPRLIWVLVPAFITLAMAVYGMSTDALRWEDDLGGRWLHASWLLLKLDTQGVFGISSYGGFLEDNGYAYSLHQLGLIGIAGLWSLYIFAPVRSPDAWRFRAPLVTYICLLMVVSASFYSIKTAGLLWFCAGAVDVWRGFAAGRQRVEDPSASR